MLKTMKRPKISAENTLHIGVVIMRSKLVSRQTIRSSPKYGMVDQKALGKILFTL
jgi:hypothetical protein